MSTRAFRPCLLVLLAVAGLAAAPAEVYQRRTNWVETVVATRAALSQVAPEQRAPLLPPVLERLRTDFPVALDWLRQDGGLDSTRWLDPATAAAADQELCAKVAAAGDASLARYGTACQARRAARLRPLLARYRTLVFAMHGPLGGSHYAYTEAQTDAQAERNFVPGARLCRLDLGAAEPVIETLLDSPQGSIRDADVSYDGRRVLFAWKQSDRGDDYHLYEWDAATRQVRQLTNGAGVADYEGAYLPDGGIVFNSTRCVQTVDCWWTEVSNLYACGPHGDGIRRLTYDQVHDNYPAVTPDGRVIYTRWDYNDRGQLFPQGLFQMNGDGTGQTAAYGNNSWFPTTIAHARGIPGSARFVAVATGHHSYQPGKLVVIDPSRGREENAGVQLIAPERPTPADRIDAYGQQGDLFAYPYPLSDDLFLVTYSPTGYRDRRGRGWDTSFGLYLMDRAGHRELLAADAKLSCGRAVPLAPRPAVAAVGRVDPRQTEGTYYIQDVYLGPGLTGVPRGTIKKVRVIGLDFRAAGIGANGNSGPAGGALVSTPVSVSNGCWDPKVLLGDATVQADGSAFFKVPARTPVYFQALDDQGRAVQTMRSWSTLQPGESQSCIGCHESKNETPPARTTSLALRAGAQALEPIGGPPRGFSFAREIQPILDRHCIRCHDNREAAAPYRRQPQAQDLSQLNWVTKLEQEWQYTADQPAADWFQPQFDARSWRTGRAGFGRKGTPGTPANTDWLTSDVWLRRSFDLPAGTRLNSPVLVVCHDEDVVIYLNGVKAAEAEGYVVKPVLLPISPAALATLKPGRNTIAATCHQTVGGQLIDLALADGRAAPTPVKGNVFSLLSAEVVDPAAKRRWSDAYLALTQAVRDDKSGVWRAMPGDPVTWLSVQSAPPMMAPYASGSHRSRLLRMLDEGHGQVKLDPAERARLACWIDLLVPFCGDYQEANAWTPAEAARYQHFLDKRRRLEGGSAAALPVAAGREQATCELLDGQGRSLARTSATLPARFTFERDYQPGDRYLITGPTAMVLRLDAAWPETLAYAPNGRLEFRLPAGSERRCYPPEAWAGRRHELTVRAAGATERSAYRNVALNPLDLRGEPGSYPHASTNSECRNEPVFAARCAVDGQTRNTGHGNWPFQSWGPDQRTDLWWRVDFGRAVSIDQLALHLRADFPHDAWWRTATVEFSDGSREALTLAKTADRQAFRFAPRTVTWLRLTNLAQPAPLGWAALSEVEVWGRDAAP